MLSSTISALSNRLDSTFLVAYGLPAFLGVLGAVAILTVRVGLDQLEAWVIGLDAVEQGLGLLLLLLATFMLAFVFRVLARPIFALFTGSAFPAAVSAWATQRQLGKRPIGTPDLGPAPRRAVPGVPALPAPALVELVAPLDVARTQPTRLGNVLAAATEHPFLLYRMDGILWWPRLAPLLPAAFQATLSSAQAPMIALLNLSVVCWGLALSAVLILGAAAGQWVPALVIVVAGLCLAYLSYRAAVSQAGELASFVRVAFDLYRHDILTQMDLPTPGDAEEERVLWQRLTDELLHLSLPPRAPSGGDAALRDTSDDGTRTLEAG